MRRRAATPWGGFWAPARHPDRTKRARTCCTRRLDQFLASPILGDGLANILAAHVIYLQIAAGLGVLGLAFYLLVLWSTVQPIATLTPPFSLLALPSLAYVTLGFVTPVLWDRYIWAVLALALLAPRLAEAAPPKRIRRARQENEVADASG